MPLMFVFSGVTFAIGLLLYWLTTNLWTMGQQFYTIRRMPAPGSPAEKALEARRLKSGKEHKKFTIPGLTPDADAEAVQDSPVVESKPVSGQRLQPKRRKRVRPPVQGDTKAPSPKAPSPKAPSPKAPPAKTPKTDTPAAKPKGTVANQRGG
jgi:YidC/Oxa1 family membrane protein insertase